MPDEDFYHSISVRNECDLKLAKAERKWEFRYNQQKKKACENYGKRMGDWSGVSTLLPGRGPPRPLYLWSVLVLLLMVVPAIATRAARGVPCPSQCAGGVGLLNGASDTSDQ